MGNCWSCLGRTIRNDRQEEPGQFQLHQNRSPSLRSRKESIQSTEQVPLGRTIKNDRQGDPVQFHLNQSKPSHLRFRGQPVESSQENPEDEPTPSTSFEQQTSSSQIHGGEVSVVKLRSRNESIKFSELTPVEEPLLSTSPEHQLSTSPEHQSSTPQIPGGEVSVVKLRSKKESIQSVEEVPEEQPIPSSSCSSEFQPPTSQTRGGESSFNISYSIFPLCPF